MNDKSSTIGCPSCATIYRLDPERIGAHGRILKCAVCGHRFLVRPTAPSAPPVTQPPPLEPKAPMKAEPFAAPPPAVAPAPTEAAPSSRELESPALTAPDAAAVKPEATAEATAGEEESWEVDEPVAAPSFELPGTEAGEESLEFGSEAEAGGEQETGEFPALKLGESAVQEEDISFSFEEEEVAAPATAGVGEEKDNGVVEFLVEEDDGSLKPVQTRAADEPEATVIRRPERRVPRDVEMPDDTMVRSNIPGFADEPDENGDEDVKEATLLEDKAAKSAKEPERWRNPMKGAASRKSTLLKRESEASPTSGIFWLVLVMLIGGAALTTNFIDLGTWRFDPVWAGGIILMALLGFFLQNLAGLYIAGFFGLFHTLSIFSRPNTLISVNDFTGVIHLGIIVGLSLIFLVIYYILMNRKRGKFFVKEGKGQSLTAFGLGLLAIILAFWAHLVGGSIAPLGLFTIAGTPITQYHYYGGIPLDVIFQAGLLALAISFGISARRLGNRLLLLGILGILLALAAMFLLYAPLFMGEISFSLPV